MSTQTETIVKRWSYGAGALTMMDEDDDGEWVRYEDYAKLLASFKRIGEHIDLSQGLRINQIFKSDYSE